MHAINKRKLSSFPYEEMESKQHHGWWLIIIVITSSILFRENQFQAHKISNKHHNHGPPTNVTKTLYFSNFLTIIHEVKLLGNARISEEKGAIQIPDPSSQAVDYKYQVGRALYSSPIRLFDPLTLTPASFQTTFSFQLNSTINSGGSGGGGGLAFVIVPDEFTIGRPGSRIILLASFKNLRQQKVTYYYFYTFSYIFNFKISILKTVSFGLI